MNNLFLYVEVYMSVMARGARCRYKHNEIKLLLYIFLVFVNYFLILNVGD